MLCGRALSTIGVNMDELISQNLTVAFTIVAGITGWLGKVWSSRINNIEKSHLQEKLDDLKRDHEIKIVSIRKEHELGLEHLRSHLLKDTENYRVRLKKSEILFEKELDSASRFLYLNRKIQPVAIDDILQRDMEACGKLKNRVSEIESMLSTFMDEFGAIINQQVKESIRYTLKQCTDLIEREDLGDSWAEKDIHDVYKQLNTIQADLISAIRSQTTT